MARIGFGISKLLNIFKANGTNTQVLFGATLPGGDGDEQDAAPVSALYIYSNGAGSSLYQKIGTANSIADWKENGSSAAVIGTWRSEKLALVTNDTLAAGSINITTLTDNDDGIDGDDVAIGEHIIGDYDGTPVLFEITAYTSATDVTIALAGTALQDNDTFICTYFLPDPAGQENKAIVNYNGSAMLKIADVDWSVADAISMAAGYAAVNGTVSSADSVNSAIEKLDGNQQDIQTASGLAQGDTHFGTWTSPVDLLFSATATAKALFQRIGVLLMQLRGVQVTGLTTIAQVDAVPVASVRSVVWAVEAFETGTPANSEFAMIVAHNDGTTNPLDSELAKLKFTNVADFTVDINAGNMRLMATSKVGALTITARRIEVVKSVL